LYLLFTNGQVDQDKIESKSKKLEKNRLKLKKPSQIRKNHYLEAVASTHYLHLLFTNGQVDQK
jgi:hypothetical protein